MSVEQWVAHRVRCDRCGQTGPRSDQSRGECLTEAAHTGWDEVVVPGGPALHTCRNCTKSREPSR